MAITPEQAAKISAARKLAVDAEIGHLTPSKTKAWKGTIVPIIGNIIGHYFKSEELKKVEMRGNTVGTVAEFKEARKIGVSLDDQAKLWGRAIKEHTLERRNARITKNKGAFGGPVGWIVSQFERVWAEKAAGKAGVAAEKEFLKSGGEIPAGTKLKVDDVKTSGTVEEQVLMARKTAYDRVQERFDNVSKTKAWKGAILGNNIFPLIGAIVGAAFGSNNFPSEEKKNVDIRAKFAGDKAANDKLDELVKGGQNVDVSFVAKVRKDFATATEIDKKSGNRTTNLGWNLSLPGLIVNLSQESHAEKVAKEKGQKAANAVLKPGSTPQVGGATPQGSGKGR